MTLSPYARRGNFARGMVTAELALGILTATMMAVMLAWGIHLIVVQTECSDVAAQVARAEARHDSASASAARERAPAGAAVDLATVDGHVVVEVSLPVSFGRVVSVTIVGRAVMPMEPGS